MTYVLSLLDKSPIPEGASAADALARTVKLAQRAEELGFHRYWVAEHHGSRAYAGPAPEVLVAYLLAKTSRIRVGSGGVMLQHYSPYKVAEVFRLLAALAPGRVDLGVGKAPGGLPVTTRALQSLHDRERKPRFDAQLEELDAFLQGSVAQDHPLAGAVAAPDPGELPQRWLLGGSPQSAELAARLNWDFVYAGHFNGDEGNIEASIDTYRRATGRPPALALFAFATLAQAQADRLVESLRIYKLHLPSGQSFNLPSLAGVEEFARQAGASSFRTEELRPHVIAGTPGRVRAELDGLHRRWGIREFVIDTPVPGFADRLASLELLALAASRHAVAA